MVSSGCERGIWGVYRTLPPNKFPHVVTEWKNIWCLPLLNASQDCLLYLFCKKNTTRFLHVMVSGQVGSTLWVSSNMNEIVRILKVGEWKFNRKTSSELEDSPDRGLLVCLSQSLFLGRGELHIFQFVLSLDSIFIYFLYSTLTC